MLDEARYWAETQFGTADLGDARRTHRLVSIMAAIARAPDESLPRQLGSLANTKVSTAEQIGFSRNFSARSSAVKAGISLRTNGLLA